MAVKDRLKQFLELKKISQGRFERDANLSNGYVNNIRKSISPDKIENIRGVFPNINVSWLLTGDGDMEGNIVNEPSNITNYKPSLKETRTKIPYYDVDFIAGNSFESVDNNSVNPDYYMDIPDFRGCTAFRAYSDSMEGLIKSGSILFGTKTETWHEHLEFGQVYGIVCQDGRKYLKYIKKHGENPREYFSLQSENKFYDEFEIPKISIRSIWLIHGHLTKRI